MKYKIPENNTVHGTRTFLEAVPIILPILFILSRKRINLIPIFLLLPGIAGSVYADVNLSGTIIGHDGQPVSGCSVILEDMSAESAQDGKFTITGTGAEGRSFRPPSLDLILDAPFLHFRIQEPRADVRIGLEDLRGRRISMLKEGRMVRGRYSIDIRTGLAEAKGPSLKLLRCRVGRLEKVFLIPGIVSGSNAGNGMTALAKGSAVDDTLTITCTGYLPRNVPVTTYNGDIGTIALKKPNVLMLIADDMNDWTTMENGWAKTPELDKFAKTGVYFSNAHVSAQECNPSRTSFLTGLRPSTSGMYWNRHWFRDIPQTKDLVTLPQYLQQHGYETISVGKVFHHASGTHSDSVSWDQIHNLCGVKVPERYRDTPWHQHDYLARGDEYNDRAFVFGPSDIPTEETGDYRGAKFTADFLMEKHDRPFFIACGNVRPHTPLVAPQEFFDMYPIEEVRTPDTLENDLGDVGSMGQGIARNGKVRLHEIVLKHGVWKEAIQAYQACVSYVDYNMGVVLDSLDKSPHKDNTIVIFLSDHGVHLGTKEHWWKMTLWNETTHIPFIMRVPGMTQAGARTHRPIDMTCLYPTLIDLLGLPVKEDLDGKSIVPLLKNPQAEWPHAAVTTRAFGNHSVVTETHRFIQYETGFEELYIKETDSLEWHNKADNEKFTEDLEYLRGFLPKVNVPDPLK